VVIDDFNVEGVSFNETEAEPPWLVDANAPLTHATTLQRLQAIRRRRPQILDGGNSVQSVDLRQGAELNIEWQPPGLFRGKQPLRFLVGEVPYHPVTPVNPANSSIETINNSFIICKRQESMHV
jgi:hypothetical protein